jgi:hypothetical protein
MRNDFKMIVFKQFIISIKTQNDNKIKVSATGKLYHLRLRVECTLFVIYKAGRELEKRNQASQ